MTTINKLSKQIDAKNLKSLKDAMGKANVDKIPVIDISAGESTVKKWFTTGNPAINYILSRSTRKGIAGGRVYGIVGESGTGKTAMALNFAQAGDFDLVIFFITEMGAFEDSFIDNFPNLKSKTVLQQSIATVEDLEAETQTILEWLKNQEEELKIFIAVDSIANLTTQAEKDGQSGYVGGRPIKLRQFFRRISLDILKYDLVFCLLTHYTINPTKTSSNPMIKIDNRDISGGTIVKYLCSTMIEMSDNKKDNEVYKDTILGTTQVGMNLLIKKSRFGTQFMKLPIIMDTEKGFDEFTGLAKVLKDMEIMTKSGSRCYLPKIDEKLSFYENELPKILKENQKIYDSVMDAIDSFDIRSFNEEKAGDGFDVEKAKKSDLITKILSMPNNVYKKADLVYKVGSKVTDLREYCKKLIEEQDKAEKKSDSLFSTKEIIQQILDIENNLSEEKLPNGKRSTSVSLSKKSIGELQKYYEDLLNVSEEKDLAKETEEQLKKSKK